MPSCARKLSSSPLPLLGMRSWNLRCICFSMAVAVSLRARFYDRKGMVMGITTKTHHVKTANSTAVATKIDPTNTHTTNHERIRFTQMWSTGHVGTSFLAGLLPAPWFYDKADVVANPDVTRAWMGNASSNYSKNYMVWHERELPAFVRKQRTNNSRRTIESVDDLSLDEYKAMMLQEYLPGTQPQHVQNYNRFVLSHNNSKRSGWYGGKQVKMWNREGNRAALRAYLRDERVPALWSVYERYNHEIDAEANPNPLPHPPKDNDGAGGGEDRQKQNQKQQERLTHFIKVGHTAVFFDLGDYYEILSASGIDVDFVRIRRNRIDVANSFNGNLKQGPVSRDRLVRGIFTSPSMKTALLRFESLDEGPLPEQTWSNWTIFQQYLWFCDEVEARWRVFLHQHPGVVYYELAYSDATSAASDDPDASKPNPKSTKQVLAPSDIDDMALNFLDLGTALSPYMNKIEKRSHLRSKSNKPSREEQVRLAIEYAKQAPWCLQYEGKGIGIHSDVYPKLDCGILA